MVISSTVCTRARLEEILPAASAATTGSGATRLKPPFRPTFPEVKSAWRLFERSVRAFSLSCC